MHPFEMKVLHLVSSLDPAAGGVSQAVLTIIKGLSEKNVMNEVATIDDPQAPYLNNIQKITVHACGPGKTPWQYAPALLHWLQKNLSAYDAVIVHGLWQYQTYAAYKAWKNLNDKRPRVFVMPHGMLDPYFQRAKGRKIKALRNWFFWKLTENKLINNADALLFTCETEKLLARKPFHPYHPKKETVVGLGIEPPPPYMEQMKAAFDQKVGMSLENYWLFISRIHSKKGVDLLIESYLQLQKEQAQLPPLVIAGPGLETEFGKQMQRLAATDHNIFFPGMLTGDAKWGAFYGCEIFILPSHQENFGIAVVEALACGKPVLISNQVNICTEIENSHSGIIGKDDLIGTKAILKNWQDLSKTAKKHFALNSLLAYNSYFTVSSLIAKLQLILKTDLK